MKRISNHVSYKEAIKSITACRKGIDNTPGKEEKRNMVFIATAVFEPLRKALGNKPIAISSFYRSVELNEAIGGSPTSEHCLGSAMDIDADIVGLHSNKEIFKWIYKNSEFNQLILEFPDKKGEPQWVHVSKTMSENRKETLVSFKDDGGNTRYKYYR